MGRIILASASPRRKMLLEQIGLEFEVVSSNVDETVANKKVPAEVVKELAFRKAKAVSNFMSGDGTSDKFIIGADTIVVKDGAVLGKPENEAEARQMLSMLKDSWHEVLTGLSIIRVTNGQAVTDYERTRVKMKDLTDSEIQAYINSGEPKDKAGAYGIQGKGALLVEKIEGCYFNVVGLPIFRLVEMLKSFGIYVL